ncbi:MAG: Fe-S protein assembly co-chaperone HscB [Magnetococcales bacterium]|nr:Fe-S protein assembly co-chaperone HscB [Magnetococcales bacterium]
MTDHLPIVCWSCRGPTPAGLFCATCQALLPPESGMDGFRLFGVEPAFDLDPAHLESRHRVLQKQLHPDFFAHRGATERRLSLEWTTRLNESWQTLTDPVARAVLLLAHLGWKAPERPVPDLEFLEEVMTLREALEEVDPLAADALPRLAAMKSAARDRLQNEVRQLSEAFGVHRSAPDELQLIWISRLVDRLRYHRRYLEELDRLEDRAFDPET